MHIAQVAPLTEAVPPKLYGGTERVVSWLTEELVALGHEVTLFASGDSITKAKLEASWPRSLRLDGSVRDPNALHMVMVEQVYRRAVEIIPIRASGDFDPASSKADEPLYNRGGKGLFSTRPPRQHHREKCRSRRRLGARAHLPRTADAKPKGTLSLHRQGDAG